MVYRAGSIARPSAEAAHVLGASFSLLTLPTSVPAFPAEGGYWPSREGTMGKACRVLTGFMVMLGLLGGASVRGESRASSEVLDWNQAFIDALTAGGDRSHRDLRLVQRHRKALHADLRP
jgi:hypothetical protein